MTSLSFNIWIVLSIHFYYHVFNYYFNIFNGVGRNASIFTRKFGRGGKREKKGEGNGTKGGGKENWPGKHRQARKSENCQTGSLPTEIFFWQPGWPELWYRLSKTRFYFENWWIDQYFPRLLIGTDTKKIKRFNRTSNIFLESLLLPDEWRKDSSTN